MRSEIRSCTKVEPEGGEGPKSVVHGHAVVSFEKTGWSTSNACQ